LATVTDDSGRPGRSRHTIAMLLGLGLSAVLLWWAMRGLRLADVWSHIRTVPLGLLLLAVTIATLTFPIRALRWRILLRLPDGNPLPVRPAWHALAIGYLANNILPLRAGEILRAYAVSRLAPVRMSTAFASVAVERVFDALTVLIMLVIALLTADLPAEVRFGELSIAGLARRIGILAALVLVAAAVVLARPEPAIRLIEKVVPWPSLSRKLVALLHGVRDGLTALRSPSRLLALILWSVAVWTVNALSFLALFPAFGIELGFGAAVLVQGMIVVFIATPSTPGFVGTFEAAIVAALAFYRIPGDRALAYALTYHAATFVPITLLGLWSATRTIGWRELRQEHAQEIENQPA
jgi:uncharacterized protein (TIRG00374 family)